MAANASDRGMRRAIFLSPLKDFDTWLLEVDCGGQGCRRGRMYHLGALAGCVGREVRIGELLRRLRCDRCRGRARRAVLITGPDLTRTVRARSVVLLPP